MSELEQHAGKPREWLGSLVDVERDRRAQRHGPELVRAALDVLGAPDRELTVVSVAGSAGKGSVATFLAGLLAVTGVRAALYRSPHLCRWEERFVVATNVLDETVIDEELEQLHLATEAGLIGPLTRFEVETILAACLAAREGCEVLIAEAGLGARGDATAAFDAALAIVASVSDDHREELGGTLRRVAEDELAIAQRAPRVLLGELEGIAEDVAASMFADHPSVLRLGHHRIVRERRPGVGAQVVLLGDGRELMLPYLGRPAAQNVALALWAVEELLGSTLDADLVSRLAAQLPLPGAPWLHAGPPRVVSDLAHNRAAIAALAETLTESFPSNAGWSVVVGLTHGRDPLDVLTPLRGLRVERGVAVDVGVGGNTVAAALKELWPGAEVGVERDPHEAAAWCWQRSEEATVLATGSVRVAAPFRCPISPTGILGDVGR